MEYYNSENELDRPQKFEKNREKLIILHKYRSCWLFQFFDMRVENSKEGIFINLSLIDVQTCIEKITWHHFAENYVTKAKDNPFVCANAEDSK